MPNPYYPRHVKCSDGATRNVADHRQHSALVGYEVGPDAQPITPAPKPPTLEEVLTAGYSQAAAEGISSRESAKAQQGIVPYGDRPESEFVPPPVIDAGTELKLGDIITMPVVYQVNPETGIEVGTEHFPEVQTTEYEPVTVQEEVPAVAAGEVIEETQWSDEPPVSDEDAAGEGVDETPVEDAPKKNRGGRPRKVQG